MTEILYFSVQPLSIILMVYLNFTDETDKLVRNNVALFILVFSCLFVPTTSIYIYLANDIKISIYPPTEWLSLFTLYQGTMYWDTAVLSKYY